jgi:hypothetical protein
MPRLTIGIPTQGKRPDLLERAIGSALAQSVPVSILVCDQTGDALEVVQRFEERRIQYHKSTATCLWENWTEAAHNCSTELFAWHQDDDVISPHFAKRIQQGMDSVPGSVLWMGRLGVSMVGGLANWWQATGPMVPMDLLYGTHIGVHHDTISAASHFTSFALSPAVAFRVNTETCDAVAKMPKDCDLFVERLILAELAQLGTAVADPAIVGYWCIHDSNESRNQMKSGTHDAQYKVLSDHLAGLLSGHDWHDHFRGWLIMQDPGTVRHWLSETRARRKVTSEFTQIWETAAEFIGLKADPPETETAEDKLPKRAERAIRKRA